MSQTITPKPAPWEVAFRNQPGSTVFVEAENLPKTTLFPFPVTASDKPEPRQSPPRFSDRTKVGFWAGVCFVQLCMLGYQNHLLHRQLAITKEAVELAKQLYNELAPFKAHKI